MRRTFKSSSTTGLCRCDGCATTAASGRRCDCVFGVPFWIVCRCDCDCCAMTLPVVQNASAIGNGYAFDSLAEGNHVFDVVAVDGAGTARWLAPLSTQTVVDTIAPTVNITTPLPRYTNVVNHTVCVTVEDATATLATTTLTLDGVSVLVDLGSGCANMSLSTEGNHTVLGVARDLAGTAATPTAAWVVLDVSPPMHTAVMGSGTGCFTRSLSKGPVTVCNSSSAAVIGVVCVQSPSVAVPVIAPCRRYWRLVNLGSATCPSPSASSGANASASDLWTLLADAQPVVDPGTAVAAALLTSPTAHFALHSQARDDAGNADDDVVVEWWVDTAPPQSPVLLDSPVGITTATTAQFSFKLASDNSPGQVSYVYSLTANGGDKVLEGGNPAIPDPTPTNTATTQVTLSPLASGELPLSFPFPFTPSLCASSDPQYCTSGLSVASGCQRAVGCCHHTARQC